MKTIQNTILPDMRVAVLTGAGCSTASGLGDYRDRKGQWKRAQPITGQTFRQDKTARHRYWARSSVGWPVFSRAQPNLAHHALATLEQAGIVQSLITQNVDELHQKSGHREVIDLHGVLSTVSCIECGYKTTRDEFQTELLEKNDWLRDLSADYAPDGDADLDNEPDLQAKVQTMHIPGCTTCSGLMKPDVVFFGENVPKPHVEKAMEQLRNADVLLVAGSSLMVFSGFRFCRDAAKRGQPIVIINEGTTRADDLALLKIDGDCGESLALLAQHLTQQPIR